MEQSSNLANNTNYTATITTGVKDLAGNAMSQNYSWSFTTSAKETINEGGTKNSGSSKKGCFISTIAHNAQLDKHINILAEFRDKYLISNNIKNKIVIFYYKISPYITNYLTK